MPDIGGYVTNLLPTGIRTQVNQANSYLGSPKGQQMIDLGKTMIAQQISGKKDGMLMNGIQLLSPKLYNAVRLTKGNVFHLPFALLFDKRYLAYRLAKESGDGVTKLEALGILFKPDLTSAIEVLALIKEGKLKMDLKALNPLN